MVHDKILTVIVPTYNTEKLLPKCLDSLIVSSSLMDKLEVLIIIDGSPDNALAVAQDYESRYSSTFVAVNKENGGHGSTINKGLELARGKYIRVLDSDDWFDTQNFEEFLNRLTTCDQDIVITDYTRDYFDEGRQELQTFVEKKDQEEIDLTSYDLQLNSRTLFAMARCTFKTSLLREVKLFLLEKTFYVDTIISIIPLFLAKTAIYYKLNVYHYYIGRADQSVSVSNLLKNRSHLERVLQYVYKAYLANKNNLTLNKKQYVISLLGSLISEHYGLLSHLPSSDSKIELAKWNRIWDYTEDRNTLLNSKIVIAYKWLPYCLFRLVLNFKRNGK